MTALPQKSSKVAWKVRDWAEAVSLSQSYVHKMIAEKKIDSRRVGHTRLITTSPEDFINGLPAEHSEEEPPPC